VIFNTQADQWGSYAYNDSADALRIQVTPEPHEFQEWMTFGFPMISTAEATAALDWEKLRVPFMRTPCGDGMHRGGGGGNWETWEMRIHKRILDVGANDRVLRQITRIRIPREINIEIELTD